MYDLTIVSILRQLHSYYYHHQLSDISSSQKETHTHIELLTIFPQLLSTNRESNCLYRLACLDICHKRNHITRGLFFWLLSLSKAFQGLPMQ